MNGPNEQIQVSIIVPAFNEGDAISQVVQDIRGVMEETSYSFEILVVDDGSTDNTVEAVGKQGARIIQHSENRGSGASRKTGIRAARGEWIAMIDADGTYPARALPEILGHLGDYSQVIGARTSEKGTYRLIRGLAKGMIRRLASYLVGRPIPDLNSGLRAVRKTDMLKYVYLMPNGFSCVSSMTLAFLANDLPVKFVPIEYFERIGRSKFHPIVDTYNYLMTLIRIVTYFAPLKVFMPLSLLLLGAGVGKAIADIVMTSSIQESDIMLVVTGLVIGALGILADLIVAHARSDRQ